MAMFGSKTKALAASVLVLVLGGSFGRVDLLGATEGEAKKTDKDNILGTWTAVSIEMQGKAAPAHEIKDFKVVITADKIVFPGDRSGEYKLDPGKMPKALIFTPLDGPQKGKALATIYELDGDQLKWCMQNGKGDAPTEFTTKGAGDLRLLVLKRTKK